MRAPPGTLVHIRSRHEPKKVGTYLVWNRPLGKSAYLDVAQRKQSHVVLDFNYELINILTYYNLATQIVYPNEPVWPRKIREFFSSKIKWSEPCRDGG